MAVKINWQNHPVNRTFFQEPSFIQKAISGMSEKNIAQGGNGIWLVPIMIPDMIGAVYMDSVYVD